LKGRIPACERCVADRRTFVVRAWASWAVAVALLVAGVSTGSGALTGISALLVVVALVFSFCGDQFRVSGALSKDRTWVDLKGTSESFDAQIRQAVGQVDAGAQGAVQP
jgi:hypothetical protein